MPRPGHAIVVVLGHPSFYSRFGFVPAAAKGIACQFPVPDDAFMVCELKTGALHGVRGVARYLPEFGTA